MMSKESHGKIYPTERLKYAKLMVEEGYSNKKVMEISVAREAAVSRWKRQFFAELNGYTSTRKESING